MGWCGEPGSPCCRHGCRPDVRSGAAGSQRVADCDPPLVRDLCSCLTPTSSALGLGVRYEDEWGHRGATHSFLFSVAVGAAIGLLAPLFGRGRFRTGLTATLVLVSHALLDTLTDGGLGCALLLAVRLDPLLRTMDADPVSPIGLSFLSPYGLFVATTELLLFAPVFWFALRGQPPRLRVAGPRRRSVSLTAARGVGDRSVAVSCAFPRRSDSRAGRSVRAARQHGVHAVDFLKRGLTPSSVGRAPAMSAPVWVPRSMSSCSTRTDWRRASRCVSTARSWRWRSRSTHAPGAACGRDAAHGGASGVGRTARNLLGL